MGSEEAYEVIKKTLIEDKKNVILKSTIHPEIFGNFVISFLRSGADASIVCDRGEIVICNDLDGTKGRNTILSSIYDIEEDALIKAIRAL